LAAQIDEEKREIDPKSLDYYLAFGYVPSHRSIYATMTKLAPGHCLELTGNAVHTWAYWSVPTIPPKPTTVATALAQSEELLTAAVKKRLVSDVPLGCFLSGGIDSGLIVALAAQEVGEGLHTFSVGFEGASDRDDERSLAKLVADRYGTHHTELIVGAEGKAILPRILYHVAEPFVDISVLPVYQISKAAREHITVALTGDGGDESFAGYANIRAAHVAETLRSLLPRPLRRCAEALPGFSRFRRFNRQYVEKDLVDQYDLQNHWHTELRRRLLRNEGAAPPPLPAQEIVQAVQARTGSLNDALTHLYTDLHLRLPGDYLTKVDIASNMVSLEIRSPFLDHHLVEYAASLPLSVRLRCGRQKYLLRRLAQKYLPPELIHQPKRGFGPRLGEWIRGDWADPVRNLVSGSLAQRPNLFDGALIRSIVDDHMEGRADHTTRIWSLLSFEIWYQLFIDKTLSPDDSL
jgi:asparagine synthase (glutamine-hydrolysing)